MFNTYSHSVGIHEVVHLRAYITLGVSRLLIINDEAMAKACTILCLYQILTSGCGMRLSEGCIWVLVGLAGLNMDFGRSDRVRCGFPGCGRA